MRKVLLIVAIAILVQPSSGLFAQRPHPSGQDKIKEPNSVPGNDTVRKRKQKTGGQQAKKSTGDRNAIFDRLDLNRDGKLTAGEIPEPMQRRLSQMDANGDGAITRKEFAAAVIKRMQNSRTAEGGQRSPQQGRIKPQREPNAATMFQRIDRNSDGRISLDEAPERMKDKFARMDANGDGFIDEQELNSVLQKMKQGKTKSRYDSDPEATKGQLPKRPPSDG